MIAALLAEIWPYILLALAAVAGAFGLRQSGKSAGRAEVKKKQMQADIKGMTDARQAREEFDALSDDAVRDRARQRMRDEQRSR